MNQADFGLMALLLNTAILMALIGYLIGRGSETMQPMNRLERDGLLMLMAIMTLPLIVIGDYTHATIGAIFMAVAVVLLAGLIGTEAWWNARTRLRQLHRPVVESYMLSLDDLGMHLDDSVPASEKGAVWVYACNNGKGKAKSVRIETNIPKDMVHSQMWQEGVICSAIEVLDPQMPICIGVVKTAGEKAARPFWIAFEYMSESEVSYKERYELVM